jgi:hydroxymethylglutaryl-CoA lyase
MSDLPRKVDIHEEGPREGFQITSQIIATADKVRFIEALAETGLRDINCVSFVNPKKVPNMADAAAVASAIRKRRDVRYSALWLSLGGFERALQTPLDLSGLILLSASEAFSIANTGKTTAETVVEQSAMLKRYREASIPVEWASIMTAFGCNFAGDIEPKSVISMVATALELATEHDIQLHGVRLADTVGWATPVAIERVVSSVRDRWPHLRIGLHLHDTRGTGLANAYAGLRMGVDQFDAACAGLGGCPFAGHKGAAGNICTEDLAFMCEEMGIATGIDLDRLIDCGNLAEEIFGRPLPGKLMHAGTLSRFRGAGRYN